MKKIIFILVLTGNSYLFPFSAFSQAFYQGLHVMSAGMGFGGKLGSFNYNSSIPATGISYEYGVSESESGVIGAGLYVGKRGYVLHTDSIRGIFREQKWDFIIAGLHGTYHFRTRSRFDPYIQVMAGAKFLNYTHIYSLSPPSQDAGMSKISIAYSASAGTRYLFSNNIAAFIEGGYGVAYITIGVTIKVF